MAANDKSLQNHALFTRNVNKLSTLLLFNSKPQWKLYLSGQFASRSVCVLPRVSGCGGMRVEQFASRRLLISVTVSFEAEIDDRAFHTLISYR
jgi:hypothetical protein